MTMQKILVAHDFSDGSSRALAFAAQLAQDTGAQLALAYVHPDVYDGRGDPSLTLPAALPGQGERFLRFLEEELRRVAKPICRADQGELEVHVRRGDPAKQIERVAEECGADVICLGATGKGAVQRVLLGSVSQYVLRSASVPVLLVP